MKADIDKGVEDYNFITTSIEGVEVSDSCLSVIIIFFETANKLNGYT